MRHRKKNIKIASRFGHRQMLLKNLASSFLFYEKMETTLTKAKLLQSYVEKLITLAKNDSVARRRLAGRKLAHRRSVKKLFEVIAPRYKDRKGGYTSVYKSKARQGDRAKLARISLL